MVTEVLRTLDDTPLAEPRVIHARIPVPIVLGALVTAATVFHAAIAFPIRSPWIVPDELIYSELAKSLGDGSLPRIRGDVSFDWGLGYPVLLAPVWALFDDVTAAYPAAKALNALIMSLTAVPAFFLARRFVGEGYAFVLAALAVAVPAMLYAGTLMTEVALYPAFVLALLGMAVALARPQTTTQVGALGAIALACTIKTGALVLMPAYVVAIVLYHWLDTRSMSAWRGRLGAYALTWLVLATIGIAAVVVFAAAGRRPQDALGTYSSVLDHLDLRTLPRWTLLHLAELDLYVAVIPLAATVIVLARGFGLRADPRERLFAALVVPVLLAWLVAVGAFASVPFLEVFEYPENVQRLQGRSTFMLAPLLFIGLALWLRDRSGSWVALAAVVIGSALFPAVIPLADLDESVRFQALALVPWVEMRDDIHWPAGVLLMTLVLGATLLLAKRLRAPAAFVLVPIAFVFVGVGLFAHASMLWASEWTRSVTWGTVPNWVDRAVGDQESVSVLWYEPPGKRFVDLAARHRLVFVGEFFNRRIDGVYELGSPMPYGLPTTKVHLKDGRVVLRDGSPAPLGEFVFAPCHVHVSGVVIARDALTGARVTRVQGPVSATVANPGSCGRNWNS